MRPIKTLIAQRGVARKNKDWKKSDELRDKIKKLGWDLKDTPEGAKLSKTQ